MPYGDKWRRHRKWYQASLETKDALDIYRPLQMRETAVLLTELIQTPDRLFAHIKRYIVNIRSTPV